MVLKTNPEPDKPPVTQMAGKADESKADEPKAKKATGPLAPAAESSDPAVHKLLADRQAWVAHTAYANEADKVAREAAEHGAEDRIAEIDEQLADLGFTAK